MRSKHKISSLEAELNRFPRASNACVPQCRYMLCLKRDQSGALGQLLRGELTGEDLVTHAVEYAIARARKDTSVSESLQQQVLATHSPMRDPWARTGHHVCSKSTADPSVEPLLQVAVASNALHGGGNASASGHGTCRLQFHRLV